MANARPPDEQSGFERQLRDVNEALLISSVRQNELLEKAQDAEAALRETESELRSRVDELARFNRAAVGRELRIIELKEKLNDLTHQPGELERYPHDDVETGAVEQPRSGGLRSVELAAASDSIAPLESILCTEELNRRPSRLPDYEIESRALSALGKAMADTRFDILQILAEKILEVLRAGSAGVSLLMADEKRFHWPAIAGAWRAHIGGGTPRDFGPCGDVLDRNAPLLFRHVERRYRYFQPVTPPVKECLLVPFYVDRVAIGTIWAVAHDEHKFDAEDLRQLQSLSVFASAAHMATDARKKDRSRSAAALNLMEDAVEARGLTELANVELRESERRLREVVDSLPAAVYTTDVRGFVTHFNAAAVDLVGRKPQLGQDQWCVSWKMFRSDGTPLPHDECPMAVALREGRPVRGVEAILERPDGTRVWVAPYPTPLKDSNGNLVGAINMVMDITERTLLEKKTKESARALAEVDRRKDEFLAMLSHELRNPLASIVNAVRLLGLEQGRSPLQTKAHGMIDRQAAQLTRLVDDLLEVSRISAGRIRLQRGRLDLVEIVQRGIETVQQKVVDKTQTLRTSLPDRAVWLNGDSARLEQVLVNLLNNANKYTHAGGEIWVSLNADGDKAVLRVRDNGIGIEPEMLPHIFELFSQAESSLGRSQGGLGVGLAVVQSLVVMHNGQVKVQSAPRAGSEFTVTLPMLASPEASTISPLESAGAPDNVLKILVVDDNIDAAKSMAMLLLACGHETRVAFDATSGFKEALAYGPDVMLLDIGLPVVSGLELAERIRKEPTLKGATLVALTGYGQESDRRRSHEAGFDHHLVKPVDLAKIERILSSTSKPAARDPERP